MAVVENYFMQERGGWSDAGDVVLSRKGGGDDEGGQQK